MKHHNYDIAGSSWVLAGMHASAGILTARGGMTSHATVVACGWGKCCVSGCADIRVTDFLEGCLGLIF